MLKSVHNHFFLFLMRNNANTHLAFFNFLGFTTQSGTHTIEEHLNAMGSLFNFYCADLKQKRKGEMTQNDGK